MRIIAAHLHPYALPLRAEWRSAAGRLTQRTGWLLQLASEDGRSGWGECAPLPSHGSEDHAQACAALTRWQAALPGQKVGDTLAALAAAASFSTPAARAAIECALLDLQAQSHGLPLCRHLQQTACRNEIRLNAMLGDAIGTRADTLAAAIAAGFSVIKLKLGIAPPDEELAALRRLAAGLPTDITLRLDANRAWDSATATRFLQDISGLPIESVEEPLNTPDLTALRRLQDSLPYPLALDESIANVDPQPLFDTPPVRRLVLKLAPLGGLLPALATARRAAAAGMQCVVTTGIDSACGTLAAAHLAAAIGNDLTHGLATSSWLEKDTGTPPLIRNDRLLLQGNEGPGGLRGLQFTPGVDYGTTP